MTVKKSTKKKLIIAAVSVIGVILLVGSFFLRDLCLRAGITEYDRREILQVKTKYSAIIDKIAQEGMKAGAFTIYTEHKGLFEKSEITADKSGEKLISSLGEELNVLCHTYCYKISGDGKSVTFEFNKSGSKSIIFSRSEPTKQSDKDICEALSDGWYYYEHIA